MSTSLIKHNVTTINRAPLPSELSVGEIAIWIQEDRAKLYTKSITNEILEINKSIELLSDLLDVDITNLRQGSFLVKRGDKFVASNVLGNITDLTDVEIIGPLEDRQYLRYDSLLEAFINVYPSYNLYELLDVDVINPNTATEQDSTDQNDKTLYYDHATETFKTRLRRNQLNQLDDVDIDLEEAPSNKILIQNSEGIWSPQLLDITQDTAPALGGNIDYAGNYAINQTYRINRITVTEAIHTINYLLGDYWIIQGAASASVSSCVLDIEMLPDEEQACILLLEIRQGTGQILLGGLQNVEYEDGRPINLSGPGKTDLITILVTQDDSNNIRTVISAAALNLAADGLGGTPAERYPGLIGGGGTGGGNVSQLFSLPSLYDNYYPYVELLLTFEDEIATGKTWTQDKSPYSHPTTVTATQLRLTQSPFGLAEFAAAFPDTNSSVVVNPVAPIELQEDFTIEFFINYPQNSFYRNNTTVTHQYFNSTELSIRYIGQISDTDQGRVETSRIELRIDTTTFTFSNALRLFHNQNNRYVHFALVRHGFNVYLFVDGLFFQPDNTSVTDNPVTEISISQITISIQGNLNAVRLTNGFARYTNHFVIPNMRLPLTGGAEDIIEDLVYSTSHYLGEKEIEHEIFGGR